MTLLHRYNKGISLLPSVALLLNYAYGLLNLVEEAKNVNKMCDALYRIAMLFLLYKTIV